MGTPEKISNIEPFPIIPRVPAPSTQENKEREDSVDPVSPRRSLTPSGRMEVQFWHDGEAAAPQQEKLFGPSKKKIYHAQRADRLGYLMIGVSVVVLAVTMILLRMKPDKDLVAKIKPKEQGLAELNLHQGNYAFTKKMAEERAAKASRMRSSSGETNSLQQGVTEDLEITLQQQISGMAEKIERMRAMKYVEEPPPPPPDTGVVPVPEVKPTTIQNFTAPKQFQSEAKK